MIKKIPTVFILFSFIILYCAIVHLEAKPRGQFNVSIKCLDGKRRALGIYMPPTYKKGTPAPLLVWLHGGVNTRMKDRGADAVTFFMNQAKSNGILCAAPSAEKGATWFDQVGFDNIVKSIRYMVRHFSVDTNRIFIAGSSDGGTACYLIAMRNIRPRVKGFIVCSGFPLVLTKMGIQPNYSLYARHDWYIIHTGEDELYPLNVVQDHVKKMKKGGASVEFKEYPYLGHGLDYAENEKPLMLKWILSR